MPHLLHAITEMVYNHFSSTSWHLISISTAQHPDTKWLRLVETCGPLPSPGGPWWRTYRKVMCVKFPSNGCFGTDWLISSWLNQKASKSTLCYNIEFLYGLYAMLSTKAVNGSSLFYMVWIMEHSLLDVESLHSALHVMSVNSLWLFSEWRFKCIHVVPSA